MVTIVSVLLALSILVPFGVYFMGEKNRRRGKAALVSNLFSFFSVLIVATICLFGSVSVGAAGEAGSAGNVEGMAYLAAALVTGLATIGAGIAVAAASSAALGAISEDPKVMGKALIFVALAEGIALYGLLVSFTILGKF